MYLQTKKVVIIYIVTVVSLLSVISTLYNETQDKAMQISVVSAEELSYKISFAQNIYSEFSVDSTDQQELTQYGASLYQLTDSSQAQFQNIVNNSDMIVVIGDSFNRGLEQQIVNNEDKQFVLVENSNDFEFDNVYQINIDYTEVYDQINRVSNENNQSLVIICNQYSQLANNIYLEHEIANNPNVKLEIVEDSTDLEAIQKQMETDLQNGFTNVYSLDPYNNSTINETIIKYNDAKALETKTSETDSEVASSETTEQVVETKDSTLRYLSLNHNEYLSEHTDTNLVSNIYDVKSQINSLIKQVLDEQLISGDIEISISNK